MSDNMNFMTSKRQQELVDAVKDAADLHLDGMSSSNAIAKIASDSQMSENETKLMVEAFNTSKTLAHVRSAQGSEKAASFDLADYDEVISKAFPNKEDVKVAFVTDYSFSETVPSFFNKVGSMLEKVAMTLIESQEGVEVKDAQEVTVRSSTPSDLTYRKAYNACDYWRKKAEEHRAKAAEMRGQVYEACEAIAESFKSPTGIRGWSTFAKEAEQLHGQVGKTVVSTIADDFGLNGIMARHWSKGAAVTLPDPDAKNHKLLKIALLSMEVAAEEMDSEDDCRRRLEADKARWFRNGGVKTASLLAAFGARALFSGGDKGGPAASVVDVPMNQDVGIESDFANARLQFDVQDMIDEDDVISSHASENPGAVLSAIRELADIHPNILNQPMALRAALRRHLEMGQTELHELSQIKDVANEFDLQRTKTLQRSQQTRPD